MGTQAAGGHGEHHHDAQRERARQQFGAVAGNYVTSASHASGQDLTRLVEMAHPKREDRVLDVGTGAGHAAFAFAPHVASVLASDITEQMIEQVRRGAAARGFANVTVRGGTPAETLPFPDGAFDIVVSRVAAHHFADAAAFLRSAFRVTVSGGALVLCDTIVPDGDRVATSWLEEIERVRDPSHARNWSPDEWQGMAHAAGYVLEHQETASAPSLQVFDAWTQRTSVTPDQLERLLTLFRDAPPEARAWVQLVECALPERYTFGLPQLLAVYRKPGIVSGA